MSRTTVLPLFTTVKYYFTIVSAPLLLLYWFSNISTSLLLSVLYCVATVKFTIVVVAGSLPGDHLRTGLVSSRTGLLLLLLFYWLTTLTTAFLWATGLLLLLLFY